jgi:hypothetical protein
VFAVVLFHTTSAAIRAEKVLKQADLAVRLIPTPRQFSSDCGIALRFDWTEAERAQALLNEAAVHTAGVRRLE